MDSLYPVLVNLILNPGCAYKIVTPEERVIKAVAKEDHSLAIVSSV